MPGSLLLAGSLRPYGVPLHAERRSLKGVGSAPVVKGVEDDLHLIVVENIFTTRHPGPHFLRIVDAHENYIQIFLVVAEIRVRGLGNAFAIVRIALGESRNLRHLLRHLPLRLHRQKVVEGWRA